MKDRLLALACVTVGLLALAVTLACAIQLTDRSTEPPLSSSDRARVIALLSGDGVEVKKLRGYNNSGTFVEQTCRGIEVGKLAEPDNWAVSVCYYRKLPPPK